MKISKTRLRVTLALVSCFVGAGAAGQSSPPSYVWSSSSFITIIDPPKEKTALQEACGPRSRITLEVVGKGAAAGRPGEGAVLARFTCSSGKQALQVAGKLKGFQEVKSCSNNLKPCSWTGLGFDRSIRKGTWILDSSSARFQIFSKLTEKCLIEVVLPAPQK
jgi:hypothetical protein